MFTGIIKDLGQIRALSRHGGDLRLEIHSRAAEVARCQLGDSIAVNGVCLTVAERSDAGFTADVSRETLDCTTLGTLETGAAVNLEPALRAGEPLGGHLVSGHIDGIAQLVARSEQARSLRLRYAAPPALTRYFVRKGSVAVDGVSLTVNAVQAAGFEVNLVPHTQAHTNLARHQPGTPVNLEVDQVARYLERLLEHKE